MYALPNKTQHKLIVKVRGGISQKLDNFNSSSASSAATGGSNSNKNKNAHFSSTSSSVSLTNNSPFKSKESSPSPSASFIKEPPFNKLTGEYEEDSSLPRPIFHSISQYHHGSKQKSTRAHKQYITPEHNEMIRYVQQSWKGVERDYKKSVNNFINNLDLNGSSSHLSKQKNVSGKKKTATTSTPLLLSGSYHHTSSNTKDSSNSRSDSFQPFDLEAFWGNRILKRLTQEEL